MKKIAALVLALVMTLSLLPTAVWAEEGQQESAAPFILNGIEIYTNRDQGVVFYNDWNTYDGLSVVKAGPDDGEKHDAVRVPYTPGQEKRLFFKAVDSAVTLTIDGGGMEDYATLGPREDSTGVYELIFSASAMGNGNVWVILSNGGSLDIIFEAESGSQGGEPFAHNGVEVYTGKSDGKGTYENWENYDGLEIVPAGPTGEGRAVAVFYTPGEAKTLFLKTVDSNVVLESIGGGLEDHATLSAMEESTGIYELTLSAAAGGDGNVWVDFGSGSIDFMFMAQSSGGNGDGENQQETELPLYIGDEVNGERSYETTFRGDVNSDEPYGLWLFVDGEEEKTEVNGGYSTAVKGYIGNFYFVEGSGFKWNTTGAVDSEGYLEVRNDDVSNTVYRMKVTLNTGRQAFTHQRVDIYTTYDGEMLGYRKNDHGDIALGINGGGGVSVFASCDNDVTSASLYLRPADGLTLVLPDHRAEYSLLSVADANGVYTLTLNDLDRNTSVEVFDGEQFIGEIDMMFGEVGGDNSGDGEQGGEDSTYWKTYATKYGNAGDPDTRPVSTVTVRLTPLQAKVITLPDVINDNNELIIRVHNAAENNEAVWRELMQQDYGFLLSYFFESVEDEGVAKPMVKSLGIDSSIAEGIDWLSQYSFNGYNEIEADRTNGVFFAWAKTETDRSFIIPTENDMTSVWVWGYDNGDGTYTEKSDGVIVKLVLDEDISKAIVLGETKAAAVDAIRVSLIDEYAIRYANLDKVLSFDEYANGAFTYKEGKDGVLTYSFKGTTPSGNVSKTVSDTILAEAAKDNVMPDDYGVVAYDLLNVTAPNGYTAKRVQCAYYTQEGRFDNNGKKVSLRYHWRGLSTDLTFILTWCKGEGENYHEYTEQITIAMPAVAGAEPWMDHINETASNGTNCATRIPDGNVKIEQVGMTACGAETSYHNGVLWTEFDEDVMLDVNAILQTTISVKIPDGAIACRMAYPGDGNDDPTYNKNNAWMPDSFQEVLENCTYTELEEGQEYFANATIGALMPQNIGDIQYYYSGDRETRLILIKWIFDGAEENNGAKYEWIRLDTEPYYCVWETPAVDNIEDVPENVEKPTVVFDGEISLVSRIHPQNKSGHFFFELEVVDGNGNAYIVQEGDEFIIVLPYEFMGVDKNGNPWTYETASKMKSAKIQHFDDDFTLKDNNGTLHGTFTERGIEFVVDSFSPFMLIWDEESIEDNTGGGNAGSGTGTDTGGGTGTGGNIGGGTTTGGTTGSTATKTEESAQTFDAGIGLYIGMSVLAVTGSAVVIGKKRK